MMGSMILLGMYDPNVNATLVIALVVFGVLGWFGLSALRSIDRSMRKIAEQRETKGKEASKD